MTGVTTDQSTRRSTSAQATFARPAPRDLLLMLVGVVGVSTSGPLIAVTAIPALAIAFWRNAFATGVLLPVALVRHRAELRGLTRSAWLGSMAAGALLAAHFACWIPSLRYTSVASSTALVCMQAVWTAVLARLAGHHVAGRTWVGMGIALVGVVAITGVDVSLSSRALLGDLLALAGGVFSASYVVVGSRVRRDVTTTTYTTLCYGSTAVLLLVACLAGGQALGGYAGIDWGRLVLLTVAAQLLGHSVFNVVLRRVSPTVVSLCILLEVPGATLLAALWLGQVPPVAAFPALALILAGLAVVVSAQSPDEPAAVPVE
jgi:drug/metabolite transporter (DMT)-like permease